MKITDGAEDGEVGVVELGADVGAQVRGTAIVFTLQESHPADPGWSL